MKPAAIILAAGESRRMGRPKALLPFRGGTFLSVLSEALSVACDPVITVFGGTLLAGVGGSSVMNADAPMGMITSLQTGIRAIPALPPRVLFTLVDHPAVRPETIARLLAVDAPIVIPRFGGKRGHPVVISRAIAEEFAAEPAQSKTRDVIDRHASEIAYLEVDDPGINDDIDDPALYEALLARDAQ